MNVHMEVLSISRRAKEEDGGIERLWKKCGGRLRLTCEGSRSGGDERAHSNEARVLQYRRYSKRETLSSIGTTYRPTVAKSSRRNPASRMLDPGNHRGITKG